MKHYWNKLAGRVDGLTLRERVVIFLMAALIVVTGMNMLVLAPLEAEQKAISGRIRDEQNEITRIRAQIQQKVVERTSDPDVHNRERLQALEAQATQLRRSVAGLQKGLVSPDRMAGLLETMLSKNSRLRLVSLKKLAVTNLADMGGDSASDGMSSATGLFRHGVELTVQGSYLDMLGYLAELERLETPLLWGDLKFEVESHPTATMTVVVYTLSMDKQWMHT